MTLLLQVFHHFINITWLKNMLELGKASLVHLELFLSDHRKAEGEGGVGCLERLPPTVQEDSWGHHFVSPHPHVARSHPHLFQQKRVVRGQNEVVGTYFSSH
jgi:hypothetical protein